MNKEKDTNQCIDVDDQKDIATKLVNGLISRYKVDASDWYHTFWELYKHRIHLFIALCNRLSIEDRQVLQDTPVLYRWWKSIQHWDWSPMYDWWFISWIFTEKWKQISYHLPIEYWDKIDVPEVWHSPEFDWHTSDDVLDRLLLI